MTWAQNIGLRDALVAFGVCATCAECLHILPDRRLTGTQMRHLKGAFEGEHGRRPKRTRKRSNSVIQGAQRFR